MFTFVKIFRICVSTVFRLSDRRATIWGVHQALGYEVGDLALARAE
jgi:hypothetical protein